MRSSATFVPLLFPFISNHIGKSLGDMAMAAAFLVLLLAAAPAVHAVQHTVGGSSGWSQSTDLPTWASGETFTVGDTLLFTYSGSHSVDVVSKSDYDNCNTGNALKSYNDGATTISLDKVGSMYFICPSLGHCQGGMKLAVTVVAASTTPTTGTTPATPSSPSGSSSPGTTPSTPSTTPAITTTTSTPHDGDAGSFGSMNLPMLRFSLVLAALVAFMG